MYPALLSVCIHFIFRIGRVIVNCRAGYEVPCSHPHACVLPWYQAIQLSRSLTDAKDIDARLPELANPIRQKGISVARSLRPDSDEDPENKANALQFLADSFLVEESELRWLATNIVVDAFNFWTQPTAAAKLVEIMKTKKFDNKRKFDEIRNYAAEKGDESVVRLDVCVLGRNHDARGRNAVQECCFPWTTGW